MFPFNFRVQHLAFYLLHIQENQAECLLIQFISKMCFYGSDRVFMLKRCDLLFEPMLTSNELNLKLTQN